MCFTFVRYERIIVYTKYIKLECILTYELVALKSHSKCVYSQLNLIMGTRASNILRTLRTPGIKCCIVLASIPMNSFISCLSSSFIDFVWNTNLLEELHCKRYTPLISQFRSYKNNNSRIAYVFTSAAWSGTRTKSRSHLFLPKPFTEEPNGRTFMFWNNPEKYCSKWWAVWNLSLVSKSFNLSDS